MKMIITINGCKSEVENCRIEPTDDPEVFNVYITCDAETVKIKAILYDNSYYLTDEFEFVEGL